MKSPLFRIIILGLTGALLLSACGGTPAAPAAPTSVPAQGNPQPVSSGKFRIAVVFPSPINDAAFSQSMYEALKAVQKDMGGENNLEIKYSENMFKVPDAAAAIRDYASQGFDLVIAHGSQYGTSLSQVAPDFPKTSFAWGTALDTFDKQGIKNVFAYQADAQLGGYVQGILAAMMSKSGILGVTGPVEAGDAKLYVDGFKQGALAANKNIKVNVSYTGSFSDVSLMAAAAETHIKAGADMLTGSSQSVVGAIGVCKDKGAKWFGAQWDQASLAPNTVVASMVYDWTSVVKDMIANHNGGTLGGKAYTLNFQNNGLKIAYNSQVPVPADAKAAADKAIQSINDGSVQVQP